MLSRTTGDATGARTSSRTTPASRALLERTHRIAVLGIKTAESGQPAYYVPAVRAARGLRDRPGAGLLSRRHGDPRRAGLPHGGRDSRRVDMVNVFRRPTRHRRARRRHHRQEAEVGLVPARHPQRRRGRAARARGHRRRAGPLPAGGAAARSGSDDGPRCTPPPRPLADVLRGRTVLPSHHQPAVQQVELPPARRELRAAQRGGSACDRTS